MRSPRARHRCSTTSPGLWREWNVRIRPGSPGAIRPVHRWSIPSLGQYGGPGSTSDSNNFVPSCRVRVPVAPRPSETKRNPGEARTQSSSLAYATHPARPMHGSTRVFTVCTSGEVNRTRTWAARPSSRSFRIRRRIVRVPPLPNVIRRRAGSTWRSSPSMRRSPRNGRVA